MYSSAPGVSSIAGGFFAGLATIGLIYIVFLLAIFSFACFILYRIIRSGVRDGMMDAHAKTGGSIGSGSSGQLNGWPPEQMLVAPPASTYQGYRGPNG